jgi:hypothetical protein
MVPETKIQAAATIIEILGTASPEDLLLTLADEYGHRYDQARQCEQMIVADEYYRCWSSITLALGTLAMEVAPGPVLPPHYEQTVIAFPNPET